MPRRRIKDKHLPPCVYRRHGAYWLVKGGKWTRLGSELEESLSAYARLLERRQSAMGALLDRVMDEAQGRRLAHNTLVQYRQACDRLGTILRDFGPEQIKPMHVAQIMDHHRDTPNAANRLRTVLKLAMDLAIRIGLRETNPVTPIKPFREEKRDRYLTDEEYSAIHAAAPAPLRLIMDMCYLTAQRIGDVLEIQLRDLTEDGILIRQAKTGRRLCIAWSPELRALVAEAKVAQPERKVIRLDAPGYLFAQRNGRLRSYRGVRDLWDRACRRAGIEDAHLHDLRAKGLTDADRQGLNATQLAGHSSEAMTRRYLRDKAPLMVAGPSKMITTRMK